MLEAVTTLKSLTGEVINIDHVATTEGFAGIPMAVTLTHTTHLDITADSSDLDATSLRWHQSHQQANVQHHKKPTLET